MRLAILIADSNGGYTVPAVKGGAVSTLVEQLVNQNEKKKLVDLDVFSFYTEEAAIAASRYSHVKFCFIRIGRLIKALDSIGFNLLSKVAKGKAVSYKTVFSLLYYIKTVSKYLTKFGDQYDAVILENNIPISWIIKLSHYKGRYFYHLHNVPRINAKCQSVFDNCTGYICVSKYVAAEICSATNAIGPQNNHRVSVVYNCIDVNHFRRMDKKSDSHIKVLREKFSIQPNEKIILFAGRLSQEKGVDILLKSIKYFHFKNYKILIVGSVIHNVSFVDSYQKEIIALSQKYKDKVQFTGYIDQLEMPYVYNMADVSVLPSVWDEPAGLTMIESMSCGTPVITTDSGGIPEYVDDCAIVIKRDKHLIENIAGALNKLFDDPALLKRYSLVGEERIKNYAIDNYLENWLDALKSE